MCGNEEYLDEICICITKENKERVTSCFLKQLFGDKKDNEGQEWRRSAKEFLKILMERLSLPYTIIQEKYHIDKSYRDTYYMYFSNQHFDVLRYSRRLSFFKGEICLDDVLNAEIHSRIKDDFLGSCVINPVSGGVIGRTLFNPEYIFEKNTMPLYIRTSNFKLNILGMGVEVEAFPYRMQDQETMCCAEVTLLNLLEYYSNSYEDYKSVNPSDIIAHEQKHSHERVLPVKGTTYPVLTKVLSDLGFSPRLYNLYAIKKYNCSKIKPKDEMKRWLHYYIESGLPVAINLNPLGDFGTGHSVVCIGHGKVDEDLKRRAKQNKLLLWEEKEEGHALINSADFYDDYIIVDDNQFLYQVRQFDNISIYPDMQVVNLAVPLYKRMFLDAPDAAGIIVSILQHKEYGITAWCGTSLKSNEDVIIRIFMASSRSFKKYRLKTLPDMDAKMVYSLMRLPRFIWVCELYKEEDYGSLNAFGEIVIDATSASNRGHKSLLMMHYPDVIACRFPETEISGFEEQVNLVGKKKFIGYKKNLTGLYE